MQVMLKNIRIAFPALGAPQAFGEGEPAYGAKLIVDPKGEVIAEAGDIETVVIADVDPPAAAQWRAAFPALGDRR